MPCTLEPWEIEFEEKRIREERGGDPRSTSARLDRYRELILDLVEAIQDTAAMSPDEVVASVISAEEFGQIWTDQVHHRRADLNRLATADGLSAKQRKAVFNATPDKPLEPQLGFDPDAF